MAKIYLFLDAVYYFFEQGDANFSFFFPSLSHDLDVCEKLNQIVQFRQTTDVGFWARFRIDCVFWILFRMLCFLFEHGDASDFSLFSFLKCVLLI